MAGIGFELRKLVQTRTLRGVLGAAFSGTLIVAGPWLVSAASMTAVQRLPFFSAPGIGFAFTGAMVWAFALSICLSAAPLYIFVRFSADLIYENRKGEASTLLLRFAAIEVLVSLPLGFALSLILVKQDAGALLLRLAFTFLFTAVNTLWAAMMTATVIRRNGGVLAAYGIGMAAMFGLAGILGPLLGAPGALFALASGFTLTALILVAMSVASLGRSPLPGAWKSWLGYLDRYRNLALAGAFYSLATWIDKAVLSLGGLGTAAPGTRFFLNPSYDNAFYYANLAIIPGLVFWTIVTETEFHLSLRRFLTWLGRRRLPDIEKAKAELTKGFVGLLARQTLFQGLLAIALALIAPNLAGFLGFSSVVFIRLLAAGVFQLVFLTGLNLLFYLELYGYAALSGLAFVVLNFGFSITALRLGQGGELAGIPYLSSLVLASAITIALGWRGLGMFDRVIFLRASGDNWGK